MYKNFLFGGLIKCEGCGSNMTSCFTNKYIAGKLNRYYYYRCTATMKQDWQACSVRQVSAERIENFCLENLERISVDKNYIENLVFRLNNDEQAGHRAGYELTDGCSKFSAENISDTLKFFINGLKTTKGIERNLFAKKFLSNIFYSPESIKIRFISRQSDGEAVAKASPAPPQAGLGERTLSSSKNEFVSSLLAPRTGFEPVTYRLTAGCSTIELSRNICDYKSTNQLRILQIFEKELPITKYDFITYLTKSQ